MKSFFPLLGLIVFAVFAPILSANERVETFVGRARSPDDGQLLYTEQHRRVWRDGEPVSMTTRYELPDGSLLAEREVDYIDDGVVAFRLEDQRIGYVEGAQLDDDELRLFVRENSDASIRDATVELGEDLVVDAGFDRMVAKHWDDLLDGKTVSARFAVPSRRDDYRCDISKHEEWQLDGESVVTFRMRFRGFLLSLFADPVDVTYHRETGELLRYEGISNLRDEDGDNYTVRIDLPLDQRSFEE